jgi:hypothetical protein
LGHPSVIFANTATPSMTTSLLLGTMAIELLVTLKSVVILCLSQGNVLCKWQGLSNHLTD